LARDAFRDPWLFLTRFIRKDLSVPGFPGTKEGAILNRRMIPKSGYRFSDQDHAPNEMNT
jgi:hypothetical protein